MGNPTPGPWDMNIVGRHIYIEASLRPYVHQEVAACGPTEHADQQAANARLIAAAPELLSSLQFAVKLLSALPHVNGTAQLDHMRAAIAKATGGEQ